MKKTIQTLLAGTLLLTGIHAQSLNTLTREGNAYRAGDLLVKQQVEFKDPGAAGRNITWDFSNLNIIDEKYQLNYYSPEHTDSNQIIGKEHNTYYYYELKKDTLWLKKFENRLSRIDYIQPEAILCFPFKQGDTLKTEFIENGLYCQQIEINAKGFSKVFIDASGKLITPENDTLKNVVRIKRLKEYTDTGTDSTIIIIENYQWYERMTRYPVFETIKSVTFRNDTIIEQFVTSFYFASISREQIKNNEINMVSENEILINCNTYPNPVVTDLLINFELTTNANVSFILCDIKGIPWLITSNKKLDKGNHQQKIQMNGYQRGDYGLFIKVNEKIYKMTIIKN